MMDAMDAELQRLADSYWDTMLEAEPSSATLLGDHRFDDRIEDVSAEADRQLLDRWHDLARRVEAVDPTRLNPTDRITHALLRGELDNAVLGLGWRPREMAWDQMDGVHSRLLTMAPQFTAPEPKNARALVVRFRRVGDMLAQAQQRFRQGLHAGRLPARVTVERSMNQLDNYLASEVAGDAFATLAGPPGWDGENAWRTELVEVVREVIRPAFQRYRQVLAEELLPVSRPDERSGLCWLGEDGADIYQRLLRCHTTVADLDADRVHDLGLTELARLREEYAQVGAHLFGTTDLEAIFTRLRHDPRLRYRHGDQILTDAERCLTAATAAMSDWFGRLPAQPCDIVAVPDFLAADSPAAYYYPPAVDGSRPGTYFVNRHNATGRGRYETAAVAFHEAIPGHHLQLALATELDHLPRFQRESLTNTAFVEGWALYAERLAEEMGLYTDDLDRLGMLAGDSLRSARLVVDTGLHAKGWSRQQAIDFMTAHTPAGPTEIAVEVDRYLAMPAQALAYKIGQLEIQQQRARAAERLTDRFDLEAFHDRILGSGSISLPVLRELARTL
ncbi:DUF885 domain-containing protein [Nocardia brevicatena]|uniref:DUF885 domain-containing protein n=1 Tax=Nocardia brevicatena TaxID=37327 RepID=UPI000303713F|nr:DUF885 domain-containing protein [Nocardia brevicatena]